MKRPFKYLIIVLLLILVFGAVGAFANSLRNQNDTHPTVAAIPEDPCPDTLLTNFEQDQSMPGVLEKTANSLADAFQNATGTCFLTITDADVEEVPQQIGNLLNL